jgi:hypothetical protein
MLMLVLFGILAIYVPGYCHFKSFFELLYLHSVMMLLGDAVLV